MRRIDALWSERTDGLLFANLVDFDMLYGHRRDVAGYARALAEFDTWLAGFLPTLEPEDWVLLTADHGNDPTWSGTDHTRERVPLWFFHAGPGRSLGVRSTYADVAATLSVRFGLTETGPGRAFV
jgi:phosphopentomutase